MFLLPLLRTLKEKTKYIIIPKENAQNLLKEIHWLNGKNRQLFEYSNIKMDRYHLPFLESYIFTFRPEC